MILPAGITGFCGCDAVPLLVTDIRAFRQHCHEAARLADGRVTSATNPGIGNNFAFAILELPTGPVTILLNVHIPVIGFTDPITEGENLTRFRDCRPLAEVFRGFGVYEVLGAAMLEQSPHPDQLRQLSEIERQQIAYWKPQRIGEIVFNFWD